jgi:hypothetical protein
MLFKFDSTAIYSVECENGNGEVSVTYRSNPDKSYDFETGDSFMIEAFCVENNIDAEGTEKQSIGKQIAQWKKDGILTPVTV